MEAKVELNSRLQELHSNRVKKIWLIMGKAAYFPSYGTSLVFCFKKKREILGGVRLL